MNQEDQIKPWVRSIAASVIPFNEEGKFWIDSKYDGRVCLTEERWKHALERHPESDLEMNFDRVLETLKSPDEAVPEGNTRIYYKNYVMGISFDNRDVLLPVDRQELTVVIQVSDKFIITIFEQPDIKERHKPKEDDENV